MTKTRLAALLVSGGAAIMLVTLVAAPGPWWQGYVSEAGTAGQPYAVPYRWGLVLLAAGVAALSRAVLVPPAATALAVASVLAGVSGVVPCSNQCPLPPYEPTTLADVVHTAASILGMLLLAGAMALLWRRDPRPVTRRLSAVATALIVPLGAGLGLTMLFVGRGTLGAVLERLALVVAVAWLVLIPVAAERGDGDATGMPEGFTYRVRKNGDIEMLHHERPAGVLRGAAAARFLAEVVQGDPQELMARLTGNYRHGNERTARNHPRNRGR